MATLLDARGKYAEAEALYRQAMEARQRLLGNEDPDTISSMNGVALTLMSQGRYGEAEGYATKVLEVRRRIFGDAHPRTLEAMGNMAYLLYESGRVAEAETLYRKTLEGRREGLGRQHPDTLRSLVILGALYTEQGLGSKAEPLLREALELAEAHRVDVVGDEVVHAPSASMYIDRKQRPRTHSGSLSGLIVGDPIFDHEAAVVRQSALLGDDPRNRCQGTKVALPQGRSGPVCGFTVEQEEVMRAKLRGLFAPRRHSREPRISALSFVISNVEAIQRGSNDPAGGPTCREATWTAVAKLTSTTALRSTLPMESPWARPATTSGPTSTSMATWIRPITPLSVATSGNP